VTPDQEQPPSAEMPAEETREPWKRRNRRAGWFLRLMTASAGFLVGTVLLLLPWDLSWDQNYLSGWGGGWYSIWMNPYFRGAVSGVGAVNLYIAIAELIGLVRGSRN
jgi:hypothetical protein